MLYRVRPLLTRTSKLSSETRSINILLLVKVTCILHIHVVIVLYSRNCKACRWRSTTENGTRLGLVRFSPVMLFVLALRKLPKSLFFFQRQEDIVTSVSQSKLIARARDPLPHAKKLKSLFVRHTGGIE